MSKLRITAADCTPDLPWDGAQEEGTPDNEAKVTLSDGTEVFVNLRTNGPHTMLEVSNDRGQTVAAINVTMFRS